MLFTVVGERIFHFWKKRSLTLLGLLRPGLTMAEPFFAIHAKASCLYLGVRWKRGALISEGLHSMGRPKCLWGGAPNACGEVPQIALWLHHFLVQCSLELVACSEMSRAIHAKKNLGNAVALR